MSLIRGRGGNLLRGPTGSLTFDIDCCCTPCCPGEAVTEWEAVIEDLDNAWGGLVNLGPHSIPAGVTANTWEGNVFYDSCDAGKYFTLGINCAADCSFGMSVSNPTNNQPWAGASGGFTVAPQVSIDVTAGAWTIVFEFTKNVDADACGWGVGAAKNFRITFTSV